VSVGGHAAAAVALLALAAAACGGADRDQIAAQGRVDLAPFPFVDATIPEAPFLFGGPSAPPAAPAPAIVLPPGGDGGQPFSWLRGDPRSGVFRLSLTGERDPYDFYLPCAAASCSYPLPAALWRIVAAANAGRTMSAVIAGTDGAGGPVFTSAPLAIAIAAR
jgi:hypothetical protein